MILINKGLKIAFSSSAPEVVIGRAPDCELQLNFPTISKKHVRLLEENGEWIVEDQGSVNMTYINGERIIGRHPLHPGDFLRLDVYTLVFFKKEPPQLPEIVVHDPSSVIRHRLPISQPLLRIGRKLLGNHLAIDDPRISGHHMTLERQERKWVLRALKTEAAIKVNQLKIDHTTLVLPADKILIGGTTLEISAPIVKEWTTVTQSQTRLQDLYRTVRMQCRTIEETLQENFPAMKGENDWMRNVLDIFEMIDKSLTGLHNTAETLRSLVPSMETEDSDGALLAQSVRDARRCTNLSNYLDLILRNNQLVRIQNADLTLQRDLISKLRRDVQGCIETDDPTILLK